MGFISRAVAGGAWLQCKRLVPWHDSIASPTTPAPRPALHAAPPQLMLTQQRDSLARRVPLSWCVHASWQYLNTNKIGDTGTVALCDAVRSGGLGRLEKLWLASNQIGNVGMRALAATISAGALGSLTTLHIFGNRGTVATLKDACRARGIE